MLREFHAMLPQSLHLVVGPRPMPAPFLFSICRAWERTWHDPGRALATIPYTLYALLASMQQKAIEQAIKDLVILKRASEDG